MSQAPRVALLLFLAFAAFYAATTRGVFVFGDDVLVFQVTEAIVERGEVAVSASAGAAGVARAVPGRDGRSYSKYGLGLSLAAIPFDLAGRAAERGGFSLPETRDGEGNPRTGTRVFAVGLTNAVFGALAVVAMLWLALEAGFSLRVAALLAVLLGAASLFAHYAATFLSEPIAAASLTGACAAALRWRRLFSEGKGGGAERAAVISGLLAGVAVLVKVAHLIAVLPLGLWIAWASLPRRSGGSEFGLRGLLRWVLSLSLGMGAAAAYNVARFGSAVATGYGEEATRFTTPVLEGLAGLLISPGKGLLWYAPPLLLAVAGKLTLLRSKPLVFGMMLSVTLGPLLLASVYYQWHGGGCWGPRLLVPILPVALLPAGEVLERALAGSVAARAGSALAAAAGGLVVLLALLVPFDRYNREVWPLPSEPRSELIERATWTLGASPLVVHLRELPEAVATSLRLVTGAEAMPGPGEKNRPGLPDLAFVHYGSHALLQWTRLALLVAAVSAALLALALRPGQGGKALLSRPPQ